MKLTRLGCRGFSLIELMIGILISLFLVGAMILMYVNVQRSYGDQNQLVQMQDSQRLALSMLGGIISHAGYVLPAQANDAASAFTPVNFATAEKQPVNFAAGSFITGLGHAGDDTSDVISVRFQSNGPESPMDCAGGVTSGGSSQMITNTFSVSSSGELLCNVGSSAAVPLIDGLDRMKVQLGVDMDRDGSVDTYLTPDDVSSAGLWTRVYSVRLSLFFIDTTQTTATRITLWPHPVVHTVVLGNQP